MLSELTIRDFAIIEELRVTFDRGFNVLTGETGVGKSIIIDAVELLLGGRADTMFVRAGCDTALVEGTFALHAALLETIGPVLEREALADAQHRDVLVVARELRTSGRNVSRINGRTVNLALLREIGSALIDIHGQSEHLSLLRVREHLHLLDRFAGLTEQRAEFAAVVRELQDVRGELDHLLESERDAARRADLLNFQINEITSAALTPGEDEELLAERTRLANAEKLAALADEAIAAAAEGISVENELQPAAVDMLGAVLKALEKLARIDSHLSEQHDQVQALVEQLSDVTHVVRDYRDSIEFSPQRLDEVEERLDLIRNLKRKYGDTIEEVVAFGEQARAGFDQIAHAEERIEELKLREDELLREIGRLGAALTKARRAAGAQLSETVVAELADLRMEGAQFVADVAHKPDDKNGAYLPDGEQVAFDATGLDKVEFLVAPNPGEGLKPMVKIASGGETARLMLALKGVLARADRTPTLIFDEIDQGIGGRVGAVVGRKLWGLTGSHQVLCITHLPQLAGYGDAHFKVEKTVDGDRTRTHVRRLAHDAQVSELAEMLGVDSDATVQSAEEILMSVAAEKGHAIGVP
ncbi:MAG: DNA repair protein RecN [Anaerolineales bacterium]